MFDIDDKELIQLEHDLERIAAKALPYAVKSTLNGLAFRTRKHAQAIITRKMVERNAWTQKSIRVNMTAGNRIDMMSSEVGSTQDYMLTQEFSGTKSAKGKHGTPIPTSYSAGQEGQQPRTRRPSKSNRLASIKLNKFRERGRSPGQRLAIAMNVAVRSRKRHVSLGKGPHGVTQGIYRVVGGTYKGRGRSGAKLKMVQDLSRRFVRIKENPWLRPAAALAGLRVEDEYRRALEFQLRRARTFKG